MSSKTPILKKPIFWCIQVMCLSVGGLVACAGWPHGDYLPAIFFTLILSGCLTGLLSME